MKKLSVEEKAKVYDEALSRAKGWYSDAQIDFKKSLEALFPELKESEDEKIKNKLIHLIKMSSEVGGLALHKWEADEMLTWLEKQGESDKSLYIRFGDIPTNGKSKIYNGEIETGIEEGISVYPAFKDKEGNIILGLNLPITKTSLHTQQHLLEYDNRPCYLVTGDYVGKGTDGEPLIKNVRIIKEIKPYKIKQDKENNTYVINNTPNCGISLFYNEELKESEDEEIRKELITHCKNIRCVTEEGAEEIVKWIAWLEKQGEQKYKFRIGDTIKKKSTGDIVTICEIDLKNREYRLTNTGFIPFKYEYLWELVEQKPADKIEPKFNFKVGQWIVATGKCVYLIAKIDGFNVTLVDTDGDEYAFDASSLDDAHEWTIQDAKDGDVLVHNDCTFIFMGIKDGIVQAIEENMLELVPFGEPNKNNDYHPATKEQWNLLFKKMKDAGYTWDSEKKELKEIEKNPAWSGEDERICQCIIREQEKALDDVRNDKYGHSEIISDLKEMYRERIDWLKSLKERIGE